jgi:hypothetical protein
MSEEELKPIDVSKYTVTESGNVIKDIKDKLKQEAEEYVCKKNPLVTKKWFIDAFKKYDKGEKVKYLKDCEIAEYEAYLAGAEPREKRIAELEKENADLKEEINKIAFARGNLEEENAELRKVAEFQQSSNMNRYFENKKLKEGLAVGSTFNKALNSMNKSLEEERDKYRDMVFDLQQENAELKKDCIESEENNNKLQEDIQKLDVAKDLINRLLHTLMLSNTPYEMYEEIQKEAEQFLNSEVNNALS